MTVTDHGLPEVKAAKVPSKAEFKKQFKEDLKANGEEWGNGVVKMLENTLGDDAFKAKVSDDPSTPENEKTIKMRLDIAREVLGVK